MRLSFLRQSTRLTIIAFFNNFFKIIKNFKWAVCGPATEDQVSRLDSCKESQNICRSTAEIACLRLHGGPHGLLQRRSVCPDGWAPGDSAFGGLAFNRLGLGAAWAPHISRFQLLAFARSGSIFGLSWLGWANVGTGGVVGDSVRLAPVEPWGWGKWAMWRRWPHEASLTLTGLSVSPLK